MSIDTDWMICGRKGCAWQGTSAGYVWKAAETPGGTSYQTGHCPLCDGTGFYIEGPLFIPLKAEFFDAFERGEKDTEYRLRGPRWNGQTCRIGRKVVLSRGYGKARRLAGVIVGFHYDTLPDRNIPSWRAVYPHAASDAACIKIQLDPH